MEEKKQQTMATREKLFGAIVPYIEKRASSKGEPVLQQAALATFPSVSSVTHARCLETASAIWPLMVAPDRCARPAPP